MYDATGVRLADEGGGGGAGETKEGIAAGMDSLGGGGVRPVGAEGGGCNSGEQDSEAVCSDRSLALEASK